MSIIINKNESSSALRTIPFWIGSGLTGLTFSASHLQVSKNGATEANSAGTVAELGGGVYKYIADISELDTVGSLCVRFNRLGIVAAPSIVQVGSISGLSVNIVAVNGGAASGVSVVDTNVIQWRGNAIPVPQVTGIPDSNIRYINGTAASGSNTVSANVVAWSGQSVATPDLAGFPKVTLSVGNGQGQVSLTSGQVTVGTNNDKTSYTITNAAATGVANAVWDTLRGSHVLTGSFGESTNAVQSVGSVTGRLTFSVNASGIDSGAKTGFSLSANQTFNNSGTISNVTNLGTPVVVSTNNDKYGYILHPTGVDAIWDEARSGHVAVGTFGEGTSKVFGNVDGSVGSVLDGAAIAASVAAFECDGYTIENIMASMLSFMAGKVEVEDNGNNRTITYFRQDGSNAKFTIIASKSNGARAIGGSIG